MDIYKKNFFLHVNYTPSDPSIGITKKIDGQISALKNLGFDVTYTTYTEKGIEIINNDKCIYIKKFKLKNEKYKLIVRRFLLIKASIDFVKNNDFDIAYLRFSGFDWLYVKMLSIMKKRGMRVIVESLSYFPGVKYKTIKGKYLMFTTKLFEKKVKRFIDLVAAEGDLKELWGVKAVSLEIGVIVDNFRPHSYSGSKNAINFIAVGNEREYHGYDRMIKSIYEYYRSNGNLSIKLHLVGIVKNQTKKLVEKLKLQEVVYFYGKKYGGELEEIYDKCNIGIGPLTQYRIGGKKVTGLKTKEYFAKGIPYIFSGGELLIPSSYPYIMKIPDNDELIDIKKIIEFYDSIKNDVHLVKNMRRFAEENFSWDISMTKIMNELSI
ncbi:MAG: glycosyltransferase [Eubacteriales bacterium]|nr:glycosyltransferase [Eubacteriales bacterium]